MGKWRAIIPISAALVIALAASLFLYTWIRTQTDQRVPKEVKADDLETVQVVVAKMNLPGGTRLQKKDMIRTIPFLKESLPEGAYFSDSDLLVGRITIAPIRLGEPIMTYRLASEDVTIGGVSAIVAPGKRAIAVKGSKVIGISGFIRPGNRVDVLVNIKDPKTKQEITKTVLEKLLVLAAGTQIEEKGEGATAPVEVYTLEVTPEQGEMLTLAAKEGDLQFALRNMTDEQSIKTKGATISEMLSLLRGSSPKPETKKKATRTTVRKRRFTMEVIKDGKIVKQEYEL